MVGAWQLHYWKLIFGMMTGAGDYNLSDGNIIVYYKLSALVVCFTLDFLLAPPTRPILDRWREFNF